MYQLILGSTSNLPLKVSQAVQYRPETRVVHCETQGLSSLYPWFADIDQVTVLETDSLKLAQTVCAKFSMEIVLSVLVVPDWTYIDTHAKMNPGYYRGYFHINTPLANLDEIVLTFGLSFLGCENVQLRRIFSVDSSATNMLRDYEGNLVVTMFYNEAGLKEIEALFMSHRGNFKQVTFLERR